MKYNRHSIRLKGYDYSQNGWYFVTVDTWRKNKYFGNIADGKMCLNEDGLVLHEEINNTEKIRKGVVVDIFQIMPDHFHMILGINPMIGAHCHAPVQKLGNIVRGIKMIVAKRMKIEGRINTPIWQRNYYERIIRNKWEMERIRRYILYNPKKYKSPCETGALFSY